MRRRTRIILLGAIVAIAILMVGGPDWSRIGSRVGKALDRVGVHVARPVETQPYEPVSLPALPGDGWVNTGPISLESLRGKIPVIVIFSGTNPRTMDALPLVQAWHEAYARFGVQVVGVHAPEYSFAAAPEEARRVVDRLALTFPVVHDPSLTVLGSLRNGSSDVLVLVAGTDGRVQKPRFIRNPEVDAPIVEHAIRVQLRERNPEVAFPQDLPLGLALPGAGVGDLRIVRLGVPSARRGPLARATLGRTQPFTAQFRHQIEGEPYVPYPVGWWRPSAEALHAEQGGAANFVAIRYDAARVGLVAAPPSGRDARLWLLLDEEWMPSSSAGSDVRHDASGASYVNVKAPGLFMIFRGEGEHVLKVSPDEAGTALYAFTIENEAPASRP